VSNPTPPARGVTSLGHASSFESSVWSSWGLESKVKGSVRLGAVTGAVAVVEVVVVPQVCGQVLGPVLTIRGVVDPQGLAVRDRSTVTVLA
jgi:hypothetical protein